LAACGLLIVACLLVNTPPRPVPAAAPALADSAVFGLDRVWALHLQVSAKEYEAIQPPAGFGFGFGFPGGPQPPKAKAKEKRDRDRNLFGIEFPWVHGDLTAGGKTYKKVGLRYDGNATYFASAADAKRPFRIDIDRHGRQHFHGLATINLHPGSMDPSRGRQALAYAVFRSAGVLAPRTAYAEVTLTVPGRYNKEYLGLYTVVEQVDRVFVRDRFKTDRGLLLKPQRLRGIDYLGDEWARYRGQYQPQSEPTKEQARRVIAFARLVNNSSDRQFEKEIGSYLDVDAFLRFLAANA